MTHNTLRQAFEHQLPDRLDRNDEIRRGSQDFTAKLGRAAFVSAGSFDADFMRNGPDMNKPRDFLLALELPLVIFTSKRLARLTRPALWFSNRTARRLAVGVSVFLMLLEMVSWTDSAVLVGSSKGCRRQLCTAFAHLIMAREVAAAKQ